MAFLLKNHFSYVHEIHSLLNKNWVINISMKLSIVLIVIQSMAVGISWKKLPPMVPLWYSLPWGDEQLAAPFWRIILPLSCTVWQCIATLTNIYIARDHLIFAQIVSLTSFLVSLILCIVLFSIISLVT